MEFDPVRDLVPVLKPRAEPGIDPLRDLTPAFSGTPGLLDKLNNWRASIRRGAANLPASTLEGMAVLAKNLDTIGPEFMRSYEGREAQDLALFRAGQWIRETIGELEMLEGKNPGLAGSFAHEVIPEAVGSFGAFIGGGFASRAIQGSAVATSAFAAGTSGTAEAYSRAKAKGVEEDVALQAGLLGLAPGVLQVVPVFRALDRFDRLPGGGLRTRLLQALVSGSKGAAEEALMEAIGQYGQNAIARALYDEDQALGEGVLESGSAGGAAGFIVNALLAALPGRSVGVDARRQDQAGAQAQTAAEAPETAQAAAVEAEVMRMATEEAPSAEITTQVEQTIAQQEAQRYGVENVIARLDQVRNQAELVAAYEGEQGGLTGFAWRVGMNVRTAAQVDTLRNEAALAERLSAAALKTRDFDTAITEASKAQLFREAAEAATGTGSAVMELRNRPDYIPPVPEGEGVALAQERRAAQAQTSGEVTLQMQQMEDGTTRVIANKGGKFAGQANFKITAKGIEPVTVYTREMFRRQGIATAMYEAVIAANPGRALTPGTLRTEEGQAFRQSLDRRVALATQQDVADAPPPGERPSDMTAQVATPAAESLASMSLLPPGSAIWQRLIDFFRVPVSQTVRALRIEYGRKAPRFHDYATQKVIATSPHGMAAIPVLGQIVDPRARAHTPQQRSLITRAFSIQQGKTFAALWAAQQGRTQSFLTADRKTGKIKLANGESGYMSDVFEAELREPGSQPLTEQQRSWLFNEYLPLLRERVADMQAEGVSRYVDDDGNAVEVSLTYFPRPAVGKRKVETDRGSGGARPGAKQFFQKARLFDTEAEGANSEDGIIYDPSAISRVAKFLQGSYRSIADTRLGKDPDLGGVTVASRLSKLKHAHAERLSLLNAEERAEAERQLEIEAAHPVWGREAFINVGPAFFGRIYPLQTVKLVEQAFEAESAQWVRIAADVTAASKAMSAVGDLSQFLIQGIGLLGRHPVKWAQGVGNTLRALRDPNVMADIVTRPDMRRAAEEFTQSGGSLFQLQDFLAGLKEGSIATRIPIVGPVLKRLGVGYGVFIDLGKLSMWQAHAQNAPRSSWPKLAETIENALYMGRMEAIGKSPQGALLERLAFFAPAYYRAAGGLMAQALTRDVGSGLARQIIGTSLAVPLLFFFGGALLLGLEEEEIDERLNPTKGKFLMLPATMPDGTVVEHGLGNIMLQGVRLAFKAAQFHSGEAGPGLGSENNPYLQFLRARAAFLPALAHDIVLGRDYLGNPITPTQAVLRRFMPFAWQAMMPGEDADTYQQRAADAAFSFFGFRSYPESEYSRQMREMSATAREKYGREFADLALKERAALIREFKQSEKWQKREVTPRDMERFFAASERRRMHLENDIDRSQLRRLESFGLQVGAWRATIRIAGQDVPLTDAEEGRYHEILVGLYNEQIARIPDRLQNVPQADREEFWKEMQTKLRQRARIMLVREIDSLADEADVN